MKDSYEWKFGSYGEQLVATKLKSCGWMINPTSNYSGPNGNKAPVMEGTNLRLVMPDIDACKNGNRRWIEVKSKSHREWFIKWHRWIHGISLKHWNHYLKVQDQSGTPVWLFVYEKKENNIISSPIDVLLRNSRTYFGPNEQDPGGNIYFDVKAFDLFGIPAGELWQMTDNRWIPKPKAIDRDDFIQKDIFE